MPVVPGLLVFAAAHGLSGKEQETAFLVRHPPVARRPVGMAGLRQRVPGALVAVPFQPVGWSKAARERWSLATPKEVVESYRLTGQKVLRPLTQPTRTK